MSMTEQTFGSVSVTLYTEPVDGWGRCGALQWPERPDGGLEALVHGGGPESQVRDFYETLGRDQDAALDWARTAGYVPADDDLESLDRAPGRELPLVTALLQCSGSAGLTP